MKSILLGTLILFSANTFASCNDDFNAGISEYNFAAKYFDSGLNSYNRAVALSRTSNPNLVTICNLLVDSVSGFSVSNDSYTNCTNSFNSAMASCSGQDRVLASDNKKVCSGNQEIALDNHSTVLNLLKNTCYKASLATDSIEQVDLILDQRL